MLLSDKEFLIWIHARLVHVHNEIEIVDYMHRLRQIISDTPIDRVSQREVYWNSLKELIEHKITKRRSQMKAEQNRVVTITLTLSEDEAWRLKTFMQNPLVSKHAPNYVESREEQKVREDIYKALHTALNPPTQIKS